MTQRKYHSITPQAIIDDNLLLIYVNTVKTVIPNIEIINNQYKSMLYSINYNLLYSILSKFIILLNILLIYFLSHHIKWIYI